MSTTHAIKVKSRTSAGAWVLRIVLALFSLLVILPILWAFYSSFKTNTEYLTSAWALPSGLNWENYVNAIVKANMGDYFLTSIWVTALSLVILTVVTVPCSYVLSRFKFKLNKLISAFIMAGLFINANYLVVPIFLQLKNGLLNNRLILCVVYAGSTLPFYIYLLSSFLGSIPKDYEEAATIDGCGYWRTMLNVIVPMAKPGLITVMMFGFMSYWNEYMLSLTLITDPMKRTLPVGLKNLMEIQKYATDWGAMFAGLVLVMVPTMVFYACVQKKLTSGIAMGGIKG